MGFEVKILLDSVSESGARLTTMELTYPRFIHAEFMTHRMFSRNAASSRAIPIEKMIERIQIDPVIPIHWGKNQKGMQANEELSEAMIELAEEEWFKAKDDAIKHVKSLSQLELHKQIANRLLEPWMWITVICSATEWSNFFKLRFHPDAEPHMQKLAYMMQEEMDKSVPKIVTENGMVGHFPLVFPADANPAYSNILSEYGNPIEILTKISVGRCARVSYLTHAGKRDISADIELHDRLLASGHWSPFEHVAFPSENPAERSGNFIGWKQYRQQLEI